MRTLSSPNRAVRTCCGGRRFRNWQPLHRRDEDRWPVFLRPTQMGVRTGAPDHWQQHRPRCGSPEGCRQREGQGLAVFDRAWGGTVVRAQAGARSAAGDHCVRKAVHRHIGLQMLAVRRPQRRTPLRRAPRYMATWADAPTSRTSGWQVVVGSTFRRNVTISSQKVVRVVSGLERSEASIVCWPIHLPHALDVAAAGRCVLGQQEGESIRPGSVGF